MADLSTTYLGLKLKSPIIAGSSGQTNSPEKIKKLEANGAGAVVLKSIFEEEIFMEYDQAIKDAQDAGMSLEAFDYYDMKIKGDKLNAYIELIQDSKKTVEIPVIASINCVYSHEWISFAKRLEEAGADALELNMFFLPSDLERTATETETLYFDLVDKLLEKVSLPVSLKISPYFTHLGGMIQKLSETDIKGLVLFNRYFSPDINIEKEEVKPSFVFSTPAEIAPSLRWIALMSEKVSCDLAASTGIHDGEAVVKQLLAGAAAVQTASILYKKGPARLKEMLSFVEEWMTQKGYKSISDFKGKLSQDKSSNPAVYERLQFMKYYS